MGNSKKIDFSYVNIGGLLVGVIGVVLAVYFYMVSKEERELVYYVNPVKSIVFSSNNNELSVIYKGDIISSDVAAAQVAIWNKGNKAVKKENMLKEFMLDVGGDHQVLEARIRKMSRDITNISLNTESSALGRVVIDWDILEKNDGCVVQLIYTGDTSTTVKAFGIVEGQGNVRINQGFFDNNESRIVTQIIWTIIGIIVFIKVEAIYKRQYLENKRRSSLYKIAALFLFYVVLTAIYIHFVLLFSNKEPPFGF